MLATLQTKTEVKDQAVPEILYVKNSGNLVARENFGATSKKKVRRLLVFSYLREKIHINGLYFRHKCQNLIFATFYGLLTRYVLSFLKRVEFISSISGSLTFQIKKSVQPILLYNSLLHRTFFMKTSVSSRKITSKKFPILVIRSSLIIVTQKNYINFFILLSEKLTSINSESSFSVFP